MEKHYAIICIIYNLNIVANKQGLNGIKEIEER